MLEVKTLASIQQTTWSIWFMHEFYHLMFFIVNTMHIRKHYRHTYKRKCCLMCCYNIYIYPIPRSPLHAILWFSKEKDIIMNGCWTANYLTFKQVKYTVSGKTFSFYAIVLMTRSVHFIKVRFIDDTKFLSITYFHTQMFSIVCNQQSVPLLCILRHLYKYRSYYKLSVSTKINCYNSKLSAIPKRFLCILLSVFFLYTQV